MKRFTRLFTALDETTKTTEKVSAMVDYLQEAPADDAAWAIYFLCGRRIKRLLPANHLRSWAAEAAEIPAWLFDESYEAVGDLAETVALLLPRPSGHSELSLHRWITERLLPLRDADEAAQRRQLIQWWSELPDRSRLVLNKLITGGFRLGVSQRLVTRAVSQASGVDAETIAHRMMGDWQPSASYYRSLVSADTTDAVHGRPYPFLLAHPVESAPKNLGDIQDWQVEWKWDGIRAQVIRRGGETLIWSRGEERMDGRFPEIEASCEALPDGTVLDGEILAYRDGTVLPFATLQKRIGRKKIGKKTLESAPVAMFAFDLPEHNGQDIRRQPLRERRRQLEMLIGTLPDRGASHILTPEIVDADSWEDLALLRGQSRERHAEGLMLKHGDSEYGVGRARGLWWKWKIEPYTIDAVLIYAQSGSGRRASLFTDYTFALWDGEVLVPFAKAYSGLTDDEIREVDSFVRRNTIERFGPVRSVRPELVFELAFENIQRSNRHKSGVAVRFPRIARWRRDKRIEDADTLQQLKEHLR